MHSALLLLQHIQILMKTINFQLVMVTFVCIQNILLATVGRNQTRNHWITFLYHTTIMIHLLV